MNLIQSEGYYRGKVVDGGLGESSGGFPKILLGLVAEEIFDDASGQYVPADPEADGIEGHLNLMERIDKNQPFSPQNAKESLNAKQCKKVFGWDGASYIELGDMVAGTPIQFRVEPNTFNENTTLKVTWIDPIGASPVRGVEKLNADGVKALQAKYAGILASTKLAPKAVSAPKSVPAAAVKPAVKTPVAVAPKKSPGRPPRKTDSEPAQSGIGRCTGDEAWAACISLKRDDVTEDTLSEVWVRAISDTTGSINTLDEKITPEQWFQIKEDVIRQVGKV